MNPIMGRAFTEDDGKQGAARVVMLHYGLWQRRFGGDAQIVGRKLILNGVETTVVGVMPVRFQLARQRRLDDAQDCRDVAPWQINESMRQRGGRFASSVARLKPGVSQEQAQAR